ncbi:MAG: AsmA family protein, partial [Pedobacter sp.]
MHTHKKEVLASVTAQLNEGLTGELTIGNMETTFLQGFPRVSLRLENVVLRDSLFKKHNRTFLKAGRAEVALNSLALIRGAIEIKKITISNAAIDMYVDSLGYSNANVFKKKAKTADAKSSGGGSFPELRKVQLENVSFTADNRKNNKLYHFKVYELTAGINYTSTGFEADVDLEAMAESMAFNTKRGSFIKDKTLDGSFSVTYNEDDGFLDFAPERLDIGGERFIISARLGMGDSSK